MRQKRTSVVAMKRCATNTKRQVKEKQVHGQSKRQRTTRRYVDRLYEVLQSSYMAVSSVFRTNLVGNEEVEEKENSLMTEVQDDVTLGDLTVRSDAYVKHSTFQRPLPTGNVVDVIDLTVLPVPETNTVAERDVGGLSHTRQSHVSHQRGKGSTVCRRSKQSEQKSSQLFHPYVRYRVANRNPVQLAEKEKYREKLSKRYSQYQVNSLTARNLERAQEKRQYLNLLSSLTDGSLQISDQDKATHHTVPRLFYPTGLGHQLASTQSTVVSKIEQQTSVEDRLSDAKSILSFSVAEKPVKSQQQVDVGMSLDAKQAERERARTYIPTSEIKEIPQLSTHSPALSSQDVMYLGTTRRQKSLNLHSVSRRVTTPEVVEILDSPEMKPVQLLPEHVSPVAYRRTPYNKIWLDGFKSRRDESNMNLEQKITIVNKEREDYQQYTADIEREIEQKVQQLYLQSHTTDLFVPLTANQTMIVNRAFSAGPADEILSESFNIQIKRRDIATLSGMEWLNDEIINFYFNLIADRSRKQPNLPKVHVFNTFFYPTLLKNGYSRVRRWTKKVNIFNMDLVLLPIHLGIHWCLATIDFRAKCICYFDSMKASNTKCLRLLAQYLPQESQDKLKKSFSMDGWRYESLQDIPEQMNGSDCGVFACQYAEYTSRDARIDFTQEQMPYFRERMVYEIVSKELL